MTIKSVEADLPEQFKNKTNTKALCEVLDKQLSELAELYASMESLTCLDNAVGVQLDRIGEIIGLTRAEAGLLCGQTIYFDVVDDDRYRRYLKYMAFRNSNDCTYYSLITALKAVLGNSAVIEYTEDPDYPATIILEIQAREDETLNLGEIPPIKPAGVTVEYIIDAFTTIEVSHDITYYYNPDGIFCGTHFCGTWPPQS